MMGRVTETLQAADGVTISVHHYHHGASRETLVIICPGFFQSKETPTFRRLSEALAQTRDVACMDFRGHGRSGGLYTFSATEGEDLDAVLRWAAPRYARIGVLGFSLGGAVALTTASRRPEAVQSLVAVSAPCVFEDIEFRFWTREGLRTGLQGLERGCGCRPGNPLLEKERALDAVRRLRAVPLLVIHGTQDAIVGVEHSRRLYAEASEPKRLELVEGGGHAEALFRDDPAGFCRLVEVWWAQTLAPEAA
jgi:pimeloyl-ACP methyl ester carboxylesterase